MRVLDINSFTERVKKSPFNLCVGYLSQIMYGLDPVLTSVITAQLCSTPPLPMVTSPEHSWIMGTWVLWPCAKACAVDLTTVTWRLWRENGAFLCTVATRGSASGYRRKTASSSCSFLTPLASTDLQTTVNGLITLTFSYKFSEGKLISEFRCACTCPVCLRVQLYQKSRDYFTKVAH